jgi:uncharacterized protein (DUF427 family)
VTRGPPFGDPRLGALEPPAATSHCADKGKAGYRSHGSEDAAWTYETPPREAEPVRDDVRLRRGRP